jgi:predicted amidophosphoribosyltransferase
MRNRVPDEATCAICGRHFDPSETRGWCPNPSCGEWQHPSFPINKSDTEGATAETSSGEESPSGPTKPCPNCGNDVRADANFCKYCATQLTDDEHDEPAEGSDETDAAVEQCPDCGADLSGIPSDRLSTCPICMFDLSPVIDDADGTGAEPDRELTDCPNCGEDLTPIPSEMRTVCPGCRVDLDEGLDADTGATGPTSGESGSTTPSGEGRQQPPRDAQQPPSEDTPQQQPAGGGSASDSASTPIDATAGIADGYVQRLTDVGITTLGDLVASDPDTVSAKTGISARRIRGWIDDAPVDPEEVRSRGSAGQEPAGGRGEPADHGTGSAGESDGEPAGAGDSGLDQQETRIQRAPKDLVLDVMGQEITVTDGETVGREVRAAMVEAGASEEDAVYVHRKHIRIDVTDDGEFVLTRLGENSLTVNGRTVGKGSQVRIADGDEIGFSDVVTATVSIR